MPIKRHTHLAPTLECPQCHTPTMWQVNNTHRETRYKCAVCGIESVVFKNPAQLQPPPQDAA